MRSANTRSTPALRSIGFADTAASRVSTFRARIPTVLTSTCVASMPARSSRCTSHHSMTAIARAARPRSRVFRRRIERTRRSGRDEREREQSEHRETDAELQHRADEESDPRADADVRRALKRAAGEELADQRADKRSEQETNNA